MDLFSVGPQILAEPSKVTKTTRLGYCMTLAFILIMTIQAIILLYELFSRSNPQISSFELLHAIDSQNLTILAGQHVFGLSNFNGEFMYDPTIFTVLLYSCLNNTWQFIELPTQNYTNFNGYTGTAYYIPFDLNITATNGFNIYFVPCGDADSGCSSIYDFYSYIESYPSVWVYTDVKVDPYNLESPLSTYQYPLAFDNIGFSEFLVNQSFELVATTKLTRVFFQQINFMSYESYFSNSPVITYNSSINMIQTQLDVSGDHFMQDNFNVIYFQNGGTELVIQRNYLTVQTMLAALSGVSSFLMLFLGYLPKKLSNHQIYQGIISKLKKSGNLESKLKEHELPIIAESKDGTTVTSLKKQARNSLYFTLKDNFGLNYGKTSEYERVEQALKDELAVPNLIIKLNKIDVLAKLLLTKEEYALIDKISAPIIEKNLEVAKWWSKETDQDKKVREAVTTLRKKINKSVRETEVLEAFDLVNN